LLWVGNFAGYRQRERCGHRHSEIEKIGGSVRRGRNFYLEPLDHPIGVDDDVTTRMSL
jgi:hypothetical protein